MITRYTCTTCGYDKAIWRIIQDFTGHIYCENCSGHFMLKGSRITHFWLNRPLNRRTVKS